MKKKNHQPLSGLGGLGKFETFTMFVGGIYIIVDRLNNIYVNLSNLLLDQTELFWVTNLVVVRNYMVHFQTHWVIYSQWKCQVKASHGDIPEAAALCTAECVSWILHETTENEFDNNRTIFFCNNFFHFYSYLKKPKVNKLTNWILSM